MSSSAPEVDVEAVMLRVREEVARRKEAFARAPDSTRALSPGAGAGPRSFAATRARAFRLSRLPVGAARMTRRDSYVVADFLRFHERDFIVQAYRHLLRREGDEEGVAHYLSALQAGRLDRVGVLARLRYCAEGRVQGVRVRGLMPALGSSTIGRMPVLGYAWRWMVALLKLPAELSRLTRLMADGTGAQASLRAEINETIASIESALIAGASDARVPGVDGAASEGRTTRFDTLMADIAEHFGPTVEEVTARLAPRLHAFAECGTEHPIADLGSGRGDWLVALAARGLRVYGVERNLAFVQRLRSRGLDARHHDPLVHLRAVAPGSLGAVLIGTAVETAPPQCLAELIEEVHRALVGGGAVIVDCKATRELGEPELSADLLGFVLQDRGFVRIEKGDLVLAFKP